MSKNNEERKYKELLDKYKVCEEQLNKIKDSRIYTAISKMPIKLKNWLLSNNSKKNSKEKVNNVLELKSESVEIDLGKITLVIDSEKYDKVESIIKCILAQTYINYEIIVLYKNEDKIKKLNKVDDRILLRKYDNLSKPIGITQNLTYINKFVCSEYVLYLSGINRVDSNFITKNIKYIKDGYDLVINTAKNDYARFSIGLKKEKLKSFSNDLKINSGFDLNTLNKYKNVKIVKKMV